jgi:hypothetical protein
MTSTIEFRIELSALGRRYCVPIRAGIKSLSGTGFPSARAPCCDIHRSLARYGLPQLVSRSEILMPSALTMHKTRNKGENIREAVLKSGWFRVLSVHQNRQQLKIDVRFF